MNRMHVTGKEHLKFSKLRDDAMTTNMTAACCDTLLCGQSTRYHGNAVCTWPCAARFSSPLKHGGDPFDVTRLRCWIADWPKAKYEKLWSADKVPGWFMVRDKVHYHGAAAQESSTTTSATARSSARPMNGRARASRTASRGDSGGKVECLNLPEGAGSFRSPPRLPRGTSDNKGMMLNNLGRRRLRRTSGFGPSGASEGASLGASSSVRRRGLVGERELPEHPLPRRPRDGAPLLPLAALARVVRLPNLRVEVDGRDGHVEVARPFSYSAGAPAAHDLEPLHEGRRRHEAALDFQFLGHELVLRRRALGAALDGRGDRRREALRRELQLRQRVGHPEPPY